MRKLTLIFLLILVFILSACFRNAGSDTPTAQPIALINNNGLPTTEFTPQGGVTEVAGDITPTALPTETVEVASPTPTSTETPTEELLPTEEVFPTEELLPTEETLGINTTPEVTEEVLPGLGQGGGIVETTEEPGEALPLGETSPTAPSVAVAATSTSTPSPSPSPTVTASVTASPSPTATNVPPSAIPTDVPPTATTQVIIVTATPTNTPAVVVVTATNAPAVASVPTSGAATATTIPLVPFTGSVPDTVGLGQGGGIAETTDVAPTQEGITELAQVPTTIPAAQTATAIIAGATATQCAIESAAGIVSATGSCQPAAGATLPGAGQGGQVATQPAVVQVTATPVQQYPDCEHLVQIGETLSEIARTYNLSITAIANYPSNLITNPDLIRAGYPIVIPGCGRIPPTPTPGATLPAAGQGGQVTTNTATDNSTGPFTYTVLAGDNIYRLSVRYGVTMQAILNANSSITNMNVISEGQQIIIPGPPTSTPGSTTTTTTNTVVTPQVVQPTAQQLIPTAIPQQFFTPTFTVQPGTTG